MSVRWKKKDLLFNNFMENYSIECTNRMEGDRVTKSRQVNLLINPSTQNAALVMLRAEYECDGVTYSRV